MNEIFKEPYIYFFKYAGKKIKKVKSKYGKYYWFNFYSDNMVSSWNCGEDIIKCFVRKRKNRSKKENE